jgi:hypothetical protein
MTGDPAVDEDIVLGCVLLRVQAAEHDKTSAIVNSIADGSKLVCHVLW